MQKFGGALNGGPIANLESILTQEKEDAENAILEKLGVIGGPTNVREWYVDSIDEINHKNRLYELVQDQQNFVLMKMKEINIESEEQ